MARKYIGGYWDTVLKHYELIGDHLSKIKGYESYASMQETASREGGREAAIDFFLSIQVWGTPDQCYDKIIDFSTRTGAGSFNGVFSYAGMPWAEAERNIRLFASDVLPRLKQVGTVAQAAE